MKECQTVRDVIEVYLPQARRDLGEQCYQTRSVHLAKFARDLGHLLIADCGPFDLQNWLNGRPEFASAWTVQGVITSIKRAFNWAEEMELISRNPFARVRKPKAQRRRPLSDEEYQTVLRGGDPQFRRFAVFLALTGCRPGEAAGMKWSNVRLEDKCVLLTSHKTAKATGKPRLIALVPPLIKLLLWLRKRRQISTIEAMEAILRRGPVKCWELAGKMRAYGVSYHAVQRARKTMGVLRRRVRPGSPDWPGADLSPRQQLDQRIAEAWGANGFKRFEDLAKEMSLPVEDIRRLVDRHRRRKDSVLVYCLPPDYHRPRDTSHDEYVFVNFKGNGWNRHSLNCAVTRIRRRTGLPKDAKLYGLRHRFGTRGIKKKVNLKLLSLCMGHSDCRTTEHYIHEAGLTEDVQEAALQVLHGQGAIGVAEAAAVQKIIPIPQPGPVEEIQVETQHLPSRVNLGRDRPQVPLNGSNGSQTDNLLQMILQKLSQPGAATASRRSAPLPPTLKPAQAAAYEAWQWAVKHNPELVKADDRHAYAWLTGQDKFPGKLPPSLEAFCRYLSAARAFHGFTKRPELTGRPTAPPVQAPALSRRSKKRPQ
jgi:integrase